MDYRKYDGQPVTLRQVGMLATLLFAEAAVLLTGGVYTYKHLHNKPPRPSAQNIAQTSALKKNP